MARTTITAAIVTKLDRLLAEGHACALVAAELGITEYVVGVVANDKIGKGRLPRPDRLRLQPFQSPRCADAASIRMIQRMLDVKILRHGQIAREAGVSVNIVEQVSAGKRLPISTERPFLFKDLGERFLERPIRCPGCNAMISIAPCRACRALRS